MKAGFWQDDSGAVTVDWVVVTAAVVGLGLSSVVAVRSGTSSMGEAINASLSNAAVAPMRWLSSIMTVSQSFADGDFDGWSLAKQTAVGAWGVMNGPFGTDTRNTPLTVDIALGSGSSNALVEFDLLILDSWDGHDSPDNNWTTAEGDGIKFQINGQTVAFEHFVQRENHEGYRDGMFGPRSSSVELDGATYNLVMTPAEILQSNQFGSTVRDQKWRVQLEAVNAPQNFTLGYQSTADEATGNEAFGITNFTVREN
jgi:hypothetical protein